ncbi:MAG: 2-oxoglutarate dehydrogenase E1 component [Flavobacteriales bacterium AspAUS03]
MDRYSFLNALHPGHIEMFYEEYLKSPDTIEPSWRAFFQGFDFAQENYNGKVFESGVFLSTIPPSLDGDKAIIPEKLLKEFKVLDLIHAYRTRGHLFTRTNPVRERRRYEPTLDLKHFGLSEANFDTIFDAGKVIGLMPSSLRCILEHLQAVYCESIGIEYMHIQDPQKVEWIQQWIRCDNNHPKLSIEEKKHLLRKLNEAVTFENFLHTKFVGQKRFSLEGNESLLPALDELTEYAVERHQVKDFVVGMAHRGRLNILSNLFKKTYAQIFSEFDGKEYEEGIFAGDVKYHLGSTTVKKTRRGKQIKMNLAPNPSHLETVDAIVEGIARAKIDIHYQGNPDRVIPILIHGDAAVAAQGIAYEVIQMSTLEGYKTGGTIHIVVNNQVGFTTNYLDARSSIYCTDVAKILLSPVLHINADDVEAVIHAIRFAVDFRMHYHQDVFIDLLGYRKYGHNEGDEPRFTQPSLYKAIAQHPNPRDIYKKKLEKERVINPNFIGEIEAEYKKSLDQGYEEAKTIERSRLDPFMPDEWEGFSIVKCDKVLKEIDTHFPIERLREIGQVLTSPPAGKKFYRKTEKLLEQRAEMMQQKNALDWGMAELLAYSTLLDEGYHVRLSGEDVERGTFSHRHAVIKSEDEEEFILLNHLRKGQGKMYTYNSLLSEYSVLGFDYGYAMASPHTLTLWEAQFGDFSNGAQIIIDQYLSAAEDKWKIQNGLVMLLPHGYEGQGAEHSSARIERYLQLCARYNIFVVNCTTPANFYHLLRRQMKFPFRKPLIVFTPKSLLRHPRCVSPLEALAEGSFQELIDDISSDPKKVNRLIFCSGKIYYELLGKKESLGDECTALIRIEQLYPLRKMSIEDLFERYPKRDRLLWVQEEPENMGAWPHILRYFRDLPWKLIAPKESATTATGSYQHFVKTQAEIIQRALQS